MYDAHVRWPLRALSRAPEALHQHAWAVRAASGHEDCADAAESLFWGVSDAIQAKRREADHEPAHSAPWMHLLLEILRLCADARPEVRMGAIQTLIRTLQPYGAALSLDTWGEYVWKVTFSIRGVLSAPRRCAVSSVRSRVLRPPCRLLKASGRLWWRFGKRRGLSARRWAQW